MSGYKCVFYDEENQRKIKCLDFLTEEDVLYYAMRNNLKVASIKENKLNLLKRRKINYKDLRILCTQIGILLESGCEITKLFELVKSNSNQKLVKILEQVSNNLQNGNSISQSFNKTNSFSKFFISMVKAGEISGNLDIVMNRLSEYYDKEYKLKSKLKSILIYPISLIILAIISSIFILVFIIPNYQMIFDNNGLEPPVSTKIIISLSEFIRHNYILIILLNILIMGYLFYKIKTSQKIKIYIDKIKLKIPFINNITKLVITTKFSRAFYILNKSGIEITEAIEISSQVIDNHILDKEILNCKESIIRGSTISESLKLVQVFPQLFLSMIGIGEQSGSLDKVLSTISKFYEQELENNVEHSMKMIEPAIIVIVAIGIGVMIISMILPMFDTISSI